MNVRRIGLALLACTPLLFSSHVAQGHSATPARVEVRFIGEASLEELSRGGSGAGMLLYFLPARGPERPSLVVRLTKESGAGKAVAHIFDAPAGQDHVPVSVRGNDALLDASLTPTIEMIAPGGWWVRDSVVNYNLDIQINGPIYSMWGAARDEKFPLAGWTPLVRPGEPAVAISVRDADRDGLPDWELRSLLPEFRRSGYYRTNYAERKCATATRVERGLAPLWPYVAVSGGFEQPMGTFVPPIAVDWARGKVAHFSELVTVRNQNCSYSLYSINRLEAGAINRPNFEAPYAFYDLSGQGKGTPNLILRTERFPEADPWSVGIDPGAQQGRPTPRDFVNIRYSWRNAVGDGRWDYKVEVMGAHPYASRTPIAGGAIEIDAPAYEQFPGWVIGRTWPAVTFIDTENSPALSAEGIYEWTPRAVGMGYAFGWADTGHLSSFAKIAAGFRGEYRFRKEIPPRLYVSPIDNRLHLVGAEGGLWNLGGDEVLRAHNLGGGDYIDGWTRERVAVGDEEAGAQPNTPGRVEEALYAIGGHLIYSGPDGIVVRRAPHQPASLEVLPPTDGASWRSFRARVEPLTRQRRDPRDLKSWLSPFAGETLTVAAGRIAGLRATPGGFRFVLDLEPGFAPQGDALIDVRGLPPGAYAVTYDGRFSIAPLTPPALSATIVADALRPLEQGTVRVIVRNDGGQDLPTARLELLATAATGRTARLTAGPVVLPAGETTAITLPWAPPHAGRWTLAPRLQRSPEQVLALDEHTVVVADVDAAPAAALLGMDTAPWRLPLALWGLAALALGAALAFGRAWTASHEP